MILSGKELSKEQIAAMSQDALQQYKLEEAASVKMPYLVLGLIILAVAVIFYFTKMPDVKEDNAAADSTTSFSSALKSLNLKWGIAAQFFYVGAQVCVGSFFIKMATTTAGLSEGDASKYLGFFGLTFMLGRFAGTFIMRYIDAKKLLALYSVISIALCLVAIFGHGMNVVYALIAIAFFMSIMFPTIFSMGIDGLGSNTKIGSSLIVMAIVGGALLPPVLGLISDKTGNIQNGYIVPLVSFLVILGFAIKGYSAKNA
jgi:FHS family L-fucose permease-like MFS transporter